MDNFSKVIFSVIALSLVIIAFKLTIVKNLPIEAKNITIEPVIGPPTYGEMLAVKAIKDRNARRDAYVNLRNRIPLVHVQDGNITVSGDVQVRGSVKIE